MRRVIALCVIAVTLLPIKPATAAVDVFVDFVSDIGNGAGGGANGIADWIDNLGTLTSAAGVAAFTPTERATIESNIISKLSTMYGAFTGASFNTTSFGSEERISFGAYDGTAGSLGLAPLDFMNISNHTGSEGSASKVFTNNFGFIVESGDTRATQIAELSAALAGTGGHELGHALGLQHHHAYGDPGISPANYANTSDIQNTHVIATGSTGLGETGRETDRTFSTMSNLMLEAAGGGLASVGLGGDSLAGTVLMQTNSDFGAGDTGDTFGTATALALTALPISGLDAAHTLGHLEDAGDLDFYSFTVNAAANLWAQVWSDDRYNDDFDARLRLFDTDGTTLLATNDNVQYDGDTFNSGTLREEDSSLLNISLAAAGTYFLEIANLGPVAGEGEPDNGGLYSLIFGAAADTTNVPEPGSFLLMGMAGIGFGAHRSRRKNGVARACG